MNASNASSSQRLPDADEKKLAERICGSGIAATQLLFDHSCHSVAEAASVVGGTPEDFVKNVCLLASTDIGQKFVVAIVPGARRASRSRIQAALTSVGFPTHVMPALAQTSDIIKFTGYPPGGTPSFCYDGPDVVVFVDQRLREHTGVLYTGGGSERSLCSVSPEELIRASGGVVANVSDKLK